MIDQIVFQLAARPRGFHIITDEIIRHIGPLPKMGIFHLFIQHTSAAITINEDADATVRIDFENIFNQLVKEDEPYYTHTVEGSDDMPAHIKAALIGHSISIPITHHKLNLGTWQGIYLCEHRDHASGRSVLLTAQGQS